MATSVGGTVVAWLVVVGGGTVVSGLVVGGTVVSGLVVGGGTVVAAGDCTSEFGVGVGSADAGPATDSPQASTAASTAIDTRIGFPLGTSGPT
ncbi:hypothetical protein [Nocardia sp. NPDC058497]|uniref:hypothetical protein n=1 Tax=Nocardia sp. NPDC058497 TaxID=3346529 RepID=UPI003666C920